MGLRQSYLSELAHRRGINQQVCRDAFESLMEVVQVVESSLIASLRQEAIERIRDSADWPALALALQLECAIWTEDQDFFGTGVATWRPSTVERYLSS